MVRMTATFRAAELLGFVEAAYRDPDDRIAVTLIAAGRAMPVVERFVEARWLLRAGAESLVKRVRATGVPVQRRDANADPSTPGACAPVAQG